MKTRTVNEEEYKEFCEYMNQYNAECKRKREKFHNSLLYNIYLLIKK